MTLQAIITEAEKLSHREQAELLDELIRMVGADGLDAGLTPAHRVDLDRRLAEYDAGKVEFVDGDEAMSRLRERR
jgi:putative addiction module component (TIGR02574 family)